MKIVLEVEADDLDGEGQPIFDDIEKTIAEALTARVAAGVEQRVADTVKASVTKHVDDWVARALHEPIQKTNVYGLPIGGPVSFEQHMTRVVQDYLAAVVDERGNSCGWQTGVPVFTRGEQVMRRQTKDLLETELARYLECHRERLVKAIAEVVAASATAIESISAS